jgi:BirA family biotin operon repressor/biotin-[acetyl-CoA-carboxylase] ligase
MSGNKKIAGILIENIIKSNQELESIIGIGLNVNQENFDNLTSATSMIHQTQTAFNLDVVMEIILQKIEENLNLLKNKDASLLFNNLYHNYLFKINVPCVFQEHDKDKFMGIIKSVTNSGLLEVELEDDSIKYYNIKEVKMIF